MMIAFLRQRVCFCYCLYIHHNYIPLIKKFLLDVGEDCSLDEDCVFDNGKCDSGTKKCICADHYFENNKLCIAALNSPCERDNQCSHIQHAYCNTEGKYCDCKENFVSSESEEYCLPGKFC